MYRLRRIALALAVAALVVLPAAGTGIGGIHTSGAALAELPPDRPQSGGVHVAGID